MNEKKKIVTIFGSSSPREGESEYETAKKLGKLLSNAGFIIRNGGYGGTMEAAARGAAEVGGQCIGITVGAFRRAGGNKWLTEEITATNLYKRLELLTKNSSAFIILPGNTGTFAEIALTIELVNKGFIKFLPIIFIGEYWEWVIRNIISIQPSLEKVIYKVETPEEALKIISQKIKI